ncbi:MAG: hypothetical protein C5B55_06635 [Blastocatellia bacterium]|nr:MAG: hypothetical protein C5B55_06635 [Blastocatellia bacterium]
MINAKQMLTIALTSASLLVPAATAFGSSSHNQTLQSAMANQGVAYHHRHHHHRHHRSKRVPNAKSLSKESY